MKAYVFAKEAHGEQKRRYSGLPYFCHPKGVARMVEDLTKDEDMIIAALLHDVVEDCGVTFDDICEMFGDNVDRLVRQLTSNKEVMKDYPSKAEYLLKKCCVWIVIR